MDLPTPEMALGMRSCVTEWTRLKPGDAGRTPMAKGEDLSPPFQLQDLVSSNL